MKPKTIYSIVAVIIVIIAIIAVVCFVLPKPNVTIDLAQLNTTISEKDPFHQMAMMDITTETLTTVYQVEAQDIEEVIGKMPMMNVQASMYLVVKAKEGKIDTVKEQIEKIGTTEEQKWEHYLPAQYEIVKNRKIGVTGDYIYLVISENAEEIVKLIK